MVKKLVKVRKLHHDKTCFWTKKVAFLHGKKLVKLRKLHPDKTIKYDSFTLLFEYGTLGHKFTLFYTRGKPLVQKVQILCRLAPF